jgi:hypothetical protein
MHRAGLNRRPVAQGRPRSGTRGRPATAARATTGATARATAGSLLACATAGLLALTACGGPGSEAAGGRLGTAELDLLTRSGSYAGNYSVLFHAESQLIADCMSQKGFRYTVSPLTAVSGSDEARIIDMSKRRSQGYGLYAQYAVAKTAASDPAPNSSAGPSGDPATDPATMTNDEYLATLPAAKQAAYMTTLRGGNSDFREILIRGTQKVTFSGKGCEAQSRQALYGDLDDWITLDYFPQNVNSTLTGRVTKNPRYVAAVRSWKTCMTGKGYDYASPDDAYRQIKAAYTTRGATPALRRQEIAVATADGSCAGELHLPTLALSLRKQFAQSLSDADKTELRRLTALWTSSAAQARSGAGQ